MKRLSLPLLCSAALMTTGCFNKDKSTTDPETAAGQDGGDAGGSEGDQANRPSRSSASTGTRGGEGKTKGAVKTFKAPEPVREATVIPGSITKTEDLSVGEVRPTMAAEGALVEIMGSGFGDKPEDIKVMNGRSPWQVVEIYDDRIVAKVGTGSGGGNLSVEVGKQKGATTNAFAQLGGDEAFEAPATDLHGLIGSVYKHDGAEVPDFSSMEAVGTIGMAGLGFKNKPASDFEMGLTDYAIQFAGSLNVTQEGEYELCLESDDASRLLIMETLVVENTEGGDGCELVYLEAGEYDVAVQYVNQSSTPDITLMLAWTYDGGDKAPIPADQLFRP